MRQFLMRSILFLVLAFAGIVMVGCDGSELLKETVQEKSKDETEDIAQGLPSYNGEPYVEINGNQPSFDEADMNRGSFENYSELDLKGRCGVAFACIGQDLMPQEKRGSISGVKPSGWQSVQYDFVEGRNLYNRCHLIGYQLTGENANKKNLITGTRYLNIEGMLSFENQVADYVYETANHVLYRVTPYFQGDNLVASGVQMEGYSVEDQGEGICFNIFAFNVQPGVVIDYATGDSAEEGAAVGGEDAKKAVIKEEDYTENEEKASDVQQYVLNTNTKKIHSPDCDSVPDIKPENRQTVHTSREELEGQGYDACKKCLP